MHIAMAPSLCTHTHRQTVKIHCFVDSKELAVDESFVYATLDSSVYQVMDPI